MFDQRWRRLGIVLMGLAVCAGVAIGVGSPRGMVEQPTSGLGSVFGDAVPDEEFAAELRYARGLSRVFQRAAERVEPSVVHITTTSSRVGRDFFGRQVRRQSSGLGSGVIVSPDGYILTNNHVVEGATELLVKLFDGRELEGELVGGDSLRDIAVVKVDASGLSPAEFGDSAGLEVGEWVLAVGSPFGFDQTVTAGIVSAKGRGLGIMNQDYKDAEDFIQTDAAINPGNSGGPLINLDGKVVGINSAIFSRSGGSVGLGFSIPVELALAVYENIAAGRSVDFGWLGVELAEGARIARVLEASPAARAGLRVGDRVIRYRGRDVTESGHLIRSIQFTPPGSEAELVVLRNNKPVVLHATVTSRTEAEIARYGGREIPTLGMTVITATEEALGTGRGTKGLGVFVVAVEEGGIVARAGLQRGDIVLKVDGERVRTVEEFVDRLAMSGRSVRIDLQRGEVRGYTTLRW